MQFEARSQSSEGGDKKRHRQEKDLHSQVNNIIQSNQLFGINIHVYDVITQSKGLSSRLRNALGSIGLGRRSGGAYKISDYDTTFGSAHLSVGSSSSANLYPKVASYTDLISLYCTIGSHCN